MREVIPVREQGSLVRAAVLTAALLLTSLVLVPAGRALAVSSAGCRPFAVPVSIGRDLPETVRARLCVPRSVAHAGAVQVLISGATYNGSYWNFPYEPRKYSYVDAMLADGYATLDLDPLGFGRSSRPPSALVSMETQASVVHQVIRDARDGAFGERFPTVITVGHSMGTAVAWREAAAYHDVDGLIATGNLHVPGSAEDGRSLVDFLKPASLDPRFAHAGLDSGYFTTQTGSRAWLFYSAGDADPNVIAMDERTKDTVTDAYIATYLAEDVDADTARIDVPVLIAMGQDDHILCTANVAAGCSSAAALLRHEAPFYGPRACLESYVLPGAGHDLNLALNASSFFAEVSRWANARVRPGTGCTGEKGRQRSASGP